MTLLSDDELDHTLFLRYVIKCPADRLDKLFHHLIDAFCGQRNSLYSAFSDIYSLFEWWDFMDESSTFFKNYYGQTSLAPLNFKLLPSEYQKIIEDILDVRSSDLKNILIEKSHAVSPAYLKSFDWKLKLTLASDKMSQINEPRLFLDLDISGNKDKSLRLDLTKDELKSLIETMEKAKSVTIDLMIE